MITDPGWSHTVAVLCQSKHLVSFCTFLGAFVVGRCPPWRDPSNQHPPLPLKLWFVSIELSMIAFVAILIDDDDQHWNTEVSPKLPQKVFLGKVTFSDWQVALSILLIGHNSQVSISLVKSKCQSRCQSVQSSVRQVMMSVRCQPVRSWCLFHCKELKGSPLNPRLASNFSLCRFKCNFYHYNHNFSNQRITW